MPARRNSRRRQAGNSLVGLVVCMTVAGGGWLLLRPEPRTGGDLDVAESRAAAANPDPVEITSIVRATRLPADAPFILPGASLEYRIEANGPQAAVYGLTPDRARSWGFLVESSEASLRDRITTAVAAVGGTLDTRQLDVPGSEFTTLTGTWDGLLLLVTTHRDETVTVTLLDR